MVLSRMPVLFQLNKWDCPLDSSRLPKSFTSHSGRLVLLCFWNRANLRDLARNILLAFFLQERIHGSKEKDCHLLHQNNGPISPSCYTCTAQKNFQEMEEESRHFIKMMKDKVTEYNPCDIIDMNQPWSHSPIIQLGCLKWKLRRLSTFALQ